MNWIEEEFDKHTLGGGLDCLTKCLMIRHNKELEKLIEGIPDDYPNSAKLSMAFTNLKQQLRDKWLNN